MRYPYIVVDNSNDNIDETLHKLERFSDFYCAGVANNSEQALDMILDKQPEVVFLSIEPVNAKNNISLALIDQLHRYLNILPRFIILAETQKYAYDCIKAGVFDYLLTPLQPPELVKCLFKVRKHASTPLNPINETPKVQSGHIEATPEATPADENVQICIKSYGDYQFVWLNDVVYLKADNNTTDFYMQTGRKLTAYKTLKHYENNLPSNFYRIHNSYIVNSKYITRISTGKSLCYLNGNEVSVSFSKTYKENIDFLIRNISTEYL